MDAIQRRLFHRTKFAVTQTAGGPITLGGYALVWNALSSDRGGYLVRLLPNSAKFEDPTHALFNHDFAQVLGVTANQTLRISPDDQGVKVEIDLPGTTLGHDLAELVGKNYVGGMSFSMVNEPDGFSTTENGQSIFNVSGFTCDEVSITAIPAFTQTSIGIKPNSSPPLAASAHCRRQHSHQLQRFRLGQFKLRGG